jgi:hypothetical protein
MDIRPFHRLPNIQRYSIRTSLAVEWLETVGWVWMLDLPGGTNYSLMPHRGTGIRF